MEKLIIRDGDVDTAVVREFERDRRDLIRRGLGYGGVVIAAAAIPTLLRVRTAFAQAEGDAAIIEGAVGLEQIAVFAYQAAIDSDLLEAGVVGVAELFRDQEQEHADGLTTALEALGGMAPAMPESVADVDMAVEGLGEVMSQEDVLRFAIELETAAVAAYYDAHQKLEDAALLQTGASIMANEGQHLVVLRQAVGEDPSPAAFATGEA